MTKEKRESEARHTRQREHVATIRLLARRLSAKGLDNTLDFGVFDVAYVERQLLVREDEPFS